VIAESAAALEIRNQTLQRGLGGASEPTPWKGEICMSDPPRKRV